MRNTGKYLIPSIVAAALVAIGSFAWFRFNPSPAAPAPLQKIRIANVGLFSNFNVIAARKGYFAQNGLDAQVDEYDSGGTSMAALLSGKADVAVAADFVGVSNIFAHDDLTILAEVSSHVVWDVFARRDRGIKVPADLRGKRIGVTLKTAGEFYLGQFLTANGLQFKDVKLVDLSATDLVSKFESGELDAIVIFQPNGYAIRQRMGDQAVSWSAQDDRRTLALAYALRPFAEAHPDVIEKYLRALVQAADFNRMHEAESKALLASALDYDPAYMDFIWPRFIFGVTLDQDLLLDMESQARWIIANGLTDRTAVPNYLGFIWFDGLEKVSPGAVTIIH
jgi:NitT/TauT family transport system substrate-binding protein